MQFKKGYIPWNKGKKEGTKANCNYCNKEFFNLKRKKYCCKECYSNSMMRHNFCSYCKEKFHNGSGSLFCSTKCYGLDRRGIKFTKEHRENLAKANTKPNDSFRIANGYKIIKKKGIWIQEHRYIYLTENSFGHTFIPDDWCIHHRNEVKTDNRIDNLIMIPIKIHTKLHRGELRLPMTQK